MQLKSELQQSGRTKKNLLVHYRQKIVKFTVIYTTILIVIFLGQIFRQQIIGYETKLIIKLQKLHQIEYNNYSLSIHILLLIHKFEYQIFVILWGVSILFYSYNSFIAIKTLYVQIIGIALISFLQILYQSPRPFWTEQEIVSYLCENTYGHPQMLIFNVLFFMEYLKFNIQENLNRKQILIFHVIRILVMVYLIGQMYLQIVMGLTYVMDIIVGLVYYQIYINLIIFLDQQIEQRVTLLTVYTLQAKRYSYYYTLLLILALLLIIIFVNLVPNYGNNDEYVSQYFGCLKNLQVYKHIVFNQQDILGIQQNFDQTAIIFGLISSILGISRCYRQYNDESFSAGSNQLKLKKLLVILAITIPYVIFIVFRSRIIVQPQLRITQSEDYILRCVFFYHLFYMVFEFAPCYLFIKLNLVQQNDYKLIDEVYDR